MRPFCDFDRAAHCVHHAAELDDAAVAGALDDAAEVGSDCGVDEVAAERPEARQYAVLVGAGETAIADNVRDQNRRELPGLVHSSASPAWRRPSYVRSFISTMRGSPPCLGTRDIWCAFHAAIVLSGPVEGSAR